MGTATRPPTERLSWVGSASVPPEDASPALVVAHYRRRLVKRAEACRAGRTPNGWTDGDVIRLVRALEGVVIP